jgi:hypothetical protein
MGGFGQRTTPSEGVHDPLYGKALFLSNGEDSLLFITTDLLYMPGSIAYPVMEQLERTTGLSRSQICMTASHTHSGPAVVEYFTPTDNVQNYLASTISALVDLGQAAIRDAAAARLKMAVGRVGFLINRRTRGKPNRVDERIFAMAVENPSDGQTRAVLFGCGCHPVCLGYENYLISADYPGYAQRFVEKSLPTANALFFNMAEGNMIPSTRVPTDSMDPRGYDGNSFESAARIGTLLAEEVVQVLTDAPEVKQLALSTARRDCSVMPNKHDFDLTEAGNQVSIQKETISEYLGEEYFQGVTLEDPSPLKTIWADACRKVVEEDMPEASMQRLLGAICNYRVYTRRLLDPSPEPIGVPVQVIRLNEYSLLALPGEVLVEVSLDWRERVGLRKGFIVGLANDSFGYLPHRTNFNEPGAEAKYETIMNVLEPGAVEIALEEACQMLSLMGGC